MSFFTERNKHALSLIEYSRTLDNDETIPRKVKELIEERHLHIDEIATNGKIKNKEYYFTKKDYLRILSKTYFDIVNYRDRKHENIRIESENYSYYYESLKGLGKVMHNNCLIK